MTWQRTVLIIAILFALVISWLGRYELVGVPTAVEGRPGIVYRLDRWTGKVLFIAGNESYEIKPVKY